MSIERVKKTRVETPKRYEIYHVAVMPEFLIADTKSEAVAAKRKLEAKHGGQARILDLKQG
jgi:hypothetical protein